MAVEIRKLEKSDSASLVNLFNKGSEDSTAWLWQDRGPDFWSVGDLLDPRPGRYIGAFKDGRLVACSGQAACQLGSPFGATPCFLDTDLFVHPGHRTGTIAARLIRERFRTTTDSFITGGILWGVEHEPEGLRFCSRVAEEQDQRFDFPFQTELSHLSVDLAQAELPQGVQIKSLSEMMPRELLQFSELYQKQNESVFIFPKLDFEFLLRLQRVEPTAQILLSEDRGGALLCGFEFGRRWRATGRRNLVLELIKRKHGWSELKDQPIRYAMLGMFWGDRNEQLIQAALAWCQQSGWDGLALRDRPESHQWSQAVHYKRRVFIGYRKMDQFIRDWIESRPQVQVEVFFV